MSGYLQVHLNRLSSRRVNRKAARAKVDVVNFNMDLQLLRLSSATSLISQNPNTVDCLLFIFLFFGRCSTKSLGDHRFR